MYLARPETIIVRLLESSLYEYEGSQNPITPMLGLDHTDVTISTWQQGETEFTDIPATEDNFREIGNGFYAIDLPAFLEPGMAIAFISGPLFKDVTKEFIVEPQPISMAAPVGVCVITGNIRDLSGDIANTEQITFRLVRVPKNVGPSLVTSKRITTQPDAYGNFSVSLLKTATVLVEIPMCGLRVQIDVPDTETAALIDLIPPLP